MTTPNTEKERQRQRAKQRAYRARQKAKKTGSSELRPYGETACGLPGGYDKHLYDGTEPCKWCKAAHARRALINKEKRLERLDGADGGDGESSEGDV